MRHWLIRLSLVGFAASLLPLIPTPARAVPAGWSRVPVASGLNQPTAFAFRNGQIFVTEKGTPAQSTTATGQVRVVRADGSIRPVPLLTVSVNSQSERGLLGIALDPDFATNKYIYIYYTTGPNALGYSGSPKNRVSRFTFVPGTATAVDEKIIVDNIPSDAGNHNGGDIQFGFDGYLYIAVGDGGQFHADALNLSTLRGKILRVWAITGAAPVDNPHKFDPDSVRCGRAGGPSPGNGPCREIYAYGFRNPFRFSRRQSNSTLIIGDVGEGTWEELDTLVIDGNYGWNTFEGPCPVATANCDPATTPYPANFQKPIHFYKHSGTGETGATIIAGAFAENGSNYPAPFKNNYFYGDYSSDWVHVLTMDPNNVVTDRIDFDLLDQPVCFRNGPDGNIYVLSLAGTLYKYLSPP